MQDTSIYLPAIWFLFGTFLLQVLSKVPVAVAMNQEGSYDNNHPRDQQARLVGWGKRALAAHQNSFEAFPGIAAAVILAIVFQSTAEFVNCLAGIFFVSRVLYIVLYIKDIASMRSLVWITGWLVVLALFLNVIFRFY